jgi:hypothetical protein
MLVNPSLISTNIGHTKVEKRKELFVLVNNMEKAAQSVEQ